MGIAGDDSFGIYAHFSKKTTISYRLVRTCACAYQGLRNGTFPENFAFLLD